MKKSLLFILGLILICASSCEYNIIEPLVFEVPDGLSFTEDIKPFFEQKCASCHANVKPVLTDGNEYTNLMDGGYINTDEPASSEIYIKVNSGHGSDPFTPEESAYLLKWIQEGALDN